MRNVYKVFWVAQVTVVVWALHQLAVWKLFHCMCNWRGYWYFLGFFFQFSCNKWWCSIHPNLFWHYDQFRMITWNLFLYTDAGFSQKWYCNAWKFIWFTDKCDYKILTKIHTSVIRSNYQCVIFDKGILQSSIVKYLILNCQLSGCFKRNLERWKSFSNSKLEDSIVAYCRWNWVNIVNHWYGYSKRIAHMRLTHI